MFRPDYDFFDGVSLGDGHDVASSTFFCYRTNFSVKASVRHSFLGAWIYSDEDAVSRGIFLEKFACFCLSAFSVSFLQ